MFEPLSRKLRTAIRKAGYPSKFGGGYLEGYSSDEIIWAIWDRWKLGVELRYCSDFDERLCLPWSARSSTNEFSSIHRATTPAEALTLLYLELAKERGDVVKD